MGVALAFGGLPVVAVLGALLAVAGVWLLSRAIDEDAWTTAGRLLTPPGALGRALLPLLLATTVVTAFASQLLDRPLQLAVGVLLAGLIWLFVRGGGEFRNERSNVAELTEALRLSTPYPWRAFAAPVVIALASVVLFVAFGFGSQLGTWKGAGGWSGVAEWFALVLLAVAASLRIFGYATNPWRAVTAVAFSLLVIGALGWAGVLRWEDFWNRIGVTTGQASGFLLAVIVCSFAIEAWRRDSPRPPSQTQKFGRASGFWAAVASAGLLAVALSAAAIETTAGAGDFARDRFGPPTAAPTIVNTPGDSDLDLAWTFAPVLHFHHDEDYPPIRVEGFLRGATESGAKKLTSASGDPLPLSIETLPVECPDGDHDACGTISCPDCESRKKETQPEGFTPQGVFYARVARRSAQPRVFSGWNPWGSELAVLIQYWIFYGYNRWEAETVVGRLVQEHQGDWEAVSIGLNGKNTPLFVGLSAHCGGQVVSWGEIAAAPGEIAGDKVIVTGEQGASDVDVTHPLVAVAKGSHANYAVSGGHRPPDWGSCKRLPSDALSALSYASNVRDVTDDRGRGWFAYPDDVKLVTRDDKPMSYPGAWGDGETITFGYRKPVTTSRGPLSPPLQGASWRTPIQLYFCHDHWHGEDGGGIRLHGSTEECKESRRPSVGAAAALDGVRDQ